MNKVEETNRNIYIGIGLWRLLNFTEIENQSNLKLLWKTWKHPSIEFCDCITGYQTKGSLRAQGSSLMRKPTIGGKAIQIFNDCLTSVGSWIRRRVCVNMNTNIVSKYIIRYDGSWILFYVNDIMEYLKLDILVFSECLT